MSNGPATIAPSDSSRAISTPPSSKGFTIQLNPRSATGRLAGAAGFFARSSVRSMPTRTAPTSPSVQLAGSRPTGLMTYVVAWFSPRSQTSTLISISPITLTQNTQLAIELFRISGGRLTSEVVAHVCCRPTVTRLHRRYPWQDAIEDPTIGGVHGHCDRCRQVTATHDVAE